MLVEWALERQIQRQLSVCHASGISSARMGKCGQAMPVLWQLSICFQHRRGHQSPLKWWSHLSFCKGIEQPLAESPTREGKRTASKPSLWHTPSRPQAYVRGRCATGLDDMYIFVKEGIRNWVTLTRWEGIILVSGNRSSLKIDLITEDPKIRKLYCIEKSITNNCNTGNKSLYNCTKKK